MARPRDDHGTNILGNGCTRDAPHDATGADNYHSDGTYGWLNLPDDDPNGMDD